MHLADLLESDAVTTAAPGSAANPKIRGITADSRAVEAGFLFAALAGTRANGAEFIVQAIDRGAVAILAGRGTAVPIGKAVAFVRVANPRRALALAAARFFSRQPRHVAAVTGTNGKTSVASFARQIWQTLGRRSGSIGTLGAEWGDNVESIQTTTPDPVLLHRLLDRFANAGVDYAAIEASSHALDQCRVDGVRIESAAFTNLSHDHLDYHPSLEAYFACKRRLFSEVLPDGGAAVINADSPRAAALLDICRARSHRIYTFGRSGNEIALLDDAPRSGGQALSLRVEGYRYEVLLPLVGDFQTANALCALGLVLASGAQPAASVAALRVLEVVPGRLEWAAEHPSGAPIYVDYAHTPDALANVLGALRPHTRGRLSVVFGAGGDRDSTKRPAMGEVVARLADRAIVTDDNPRSEDPAAIRRAILAKCPKAREIGDRREAIQAAVAELNDGDVLLIAGKGHESGQIVAGRVFPFDDRAAVRAAVLGVGART